MKSFSDYVILGTHDSGAYRGFFNANMNGIAGAFACQYDYVTKQYDYGVRFFDIRIDDKLRVIHGTTVPILPDAIDPGIFGNLETILSDIEQKVKDNNSFAIVSLKFDKGSSDTISQANKTKLENLIQNYKAFDNSPQSSIKGMYLLNRMGGIQCNASKISYVDNGFTETSDFYIQDCYSFSNWFLAEAKLETLEIFLNKRITSYKFILKNLINSCII